MPLPLYREGVGLSGRSVKFARGRSKIQACSTCATSLAIVDTMVMIARLALHLVVLGLHYAMVAINLTA
jgi:hypothetical protein